MRLKPAQSFVVFLAGLLIAAAVTIPGCKSPSGWSVLPGSRPAARRPAPLPMPSPVRAIWVARFHYRSADDIRLIMRNCAASGINTVLWQVRGEATVAYPSRIEPWSREYKFADPGFDPLTVAVAEAHRNGLRIEAWFNVMPGWKGQTPPQMAAHVFNAHPNWFMYDGQGRRQPLNKDYVILNPCLPEVRRHIASVADEILARYDVDGLHLDYVRYAWDNTPGAKKNFPRDARTLALFRRETGLSPDDDPGAWNHWRANQLTRLVNDLRVSVDQRRPGATLTAAVWRNPTLGYQDYLQNSVAWLRSGLVDAIMPMAYTDDTAQFEADVTAYGRLAGGRRIVPGVGLYQHKSSDATQLQLARCTKWGGHFALFSYESLFPTIGDGSLSPAARAEAQWQRQQRHAVLGECVR